MAANCGVHEAYRQFARRRLDAVNHGGRVHADLAWAKLRTLADGARLASKSHWA
jgi:hypothetical protein